jgi:hypothetical protein
VVWQQARADDGGGGEGVVVELLGVRGSGEGNLKAAIRGIAAMAGGSSGPFLDPI